MELQIEIRGLGFWSAVKSKVFVSGGLDSECERREMEEGGVGV